jgi:dCTP deaminase
MDKDKLELVFTPPEFKYPEKTIGDDTFNLTESFVTWENQLFADLNQVCLRVWSELTSKMGFIPGCEIIVTASDWKPMDIDTAAWAIPDSDIDFEKLKRSDFASDVDISEMYPGNQSYNRSAETAVGGEIFRPSDDLMRSFVDLDVEHMYQHRESFVAQVFNRKSPGLLSDMDIWHVCHQLSPLKNMIEPFSDKVSTMESGPLAGKKIPSYGLSSMGYDIRLAPEWKVFDKADRGVIDLLNPEPGKFVTEMTGNDVIIPPGTTVLSRTEEWFNMPSDVLGICLGKSTLARIGLDVLVSPLEPGWSGHLVVEITNNTPNEIRIYAGVGVAQICFFRSANKPSATYKDGKYDNQFGILESKL